MAKTVPISPIPGPSSGGRALVWLLLISGTAMILYGTGALVSKNTGLLALVKYRWEGRDLAREDSRLRHEIDERKTLVNALRSDPFALERIAREAEHRVRPGEILVLPRKVESP
jgi:hypothetical protein